MTQLTATKEIQELFDFVMLSDLWELPASTEDKPKYKDVVALGHPEELEAGLRGSVNTPWFSTVDDLEQWCSGHLQEARDFTAAHPDDDWDMSADKAGVAYPGIEIQEVQEGQRVVLKPGENAFRVLPREQEAGSVIGLQAGLVRPDLFARMLKLGYTFKETVADPENSHDLYERFKDDEGRDCHEVVRIFHDIATAEDVLSKEGVSLSFEEFFGEAI